MKSNNLLNLLQGKNIVVPYYLIKYYKLLGLNEQELIFLSFLMSHEDKAIFDIIDIQKRLNLETNQVMNLVGVLTDRKLIEMIVEKNDKGIMQEYLTTDLLYKKLLMLILGEEPEEVTSNTYELIEKEFGRTLSPIEYETIKKWLDSNIGEDLIKEALREAVLNGVNNLKYIDKILYEWAKKGYKKPSDIKKKKVEEEVNLFDYDWLTDNE